MFTQTPIKSSIRSFGKYSLNAGSVPGIFLGTGDMLANETKSLLPPKTYILAGRGTGLFKSPVCTFKVAVYMLHFNVLIDILTTVFLRNCVRVQLTKTSYGVLTRIGLIFSQKNVR